MAKRRKVTVTAAADPLVDAGAYLYAARRYQKAASLLLAAIQSGPDDLADGIASLSNPIYNDPLYYLCAHTMELAFKAFMLFRGEALPSSFEKWHNIVFLHGECVRLGLHVPLDARELKVVVRLLASEHDVHGFRYHHNDSKAVPEPSWACAVAKTLVQAVRGHIGDAHGFPSAKAFKMRFVQPRYIYIDASGTWIAPDPS